MNISSMSEGTARFTFVGACGLGTFAGAAAIILGMRHSQIPAALFLAFALMGCLVTMLAYNRYTKLRNERWRQELLGSENTLSQVFNHARMTQIMEHVTGPLNGETLESGKDDDESSITGEAVRKGSVANP